MFSLTSQTVNWRLPMRGILRVESSQRELLVCAQYPYAIWDSEQQKKKRQKIFYWHTSACNSLSHIASAWPARLLYTGMHEIILPRCRVWSIQQRVCATRPSHRKKQMQGCLKRSHKRLWKQMVKQSQLIITSTKYSMQLSKLEKALILLHGAANMSDAKCCWFYNKNTWTHAVCRVLSGTSSLWTYSVFSQTARNRCLQRQPHQVQPHSTTQMMMCTTLFFQQTDWEQCMIRTESCAYSCTFQRFYHKCTRHTWVV